MLETGKQYKVVTNITDDKFSEKETDRYSLQIVLNREYFAFSINNKQGKLLKIVEINLDDLDWEDAIHFALQEFPYLHEKYLNTAVKYQSYKHTFIPENFFNEETERQFLHINCGLEDGGMILRDHLRQQESYLSYIVPEKAYTTLKDWFPNATFQHSATPFIEHLYDQITNNETGVFCNVNISNFELVVFKQGKLEFYNHFPFKNEEDLIYYLMFTYEQLSLNPEKTPMYFTGKVAQESPIFETAYKYIRNVEMLPFQIATLQGQLIEEYNCSEFYTVLV